MKYLLILLAILHVTAGKLSSSSYYNVLDSIPLSIDLYKNTDDGNGTTSLVLSPVSIFNVLGLLYMASSGITYDEMSQSLGLPQTFPCAVAESFKQSVELYKRKSNFHVANKIFTRIGLELNKEFCEIARTKFGSDVEPVDFGCPAEAVDLINHWFETRTNHKIKNLFRADSFSNDTTIVIGSAVYFNGIWKYPFANMTIKKDFWINANESVEVDMMYVANMFLTGYVDELSSKVTMIPYTDAGLSMMIILPDRNEDLSHVETNLTKEVVLDIMTTLQQRKISLYLPKFTFESSMSLKDTLTKMGLKSMFSQNADFEDMFASEAKVSVSDIIHKAYIRVDEKGTEAAAGTGVSVVALSAPEIINVNRPFIFAIMDLQKPDILFMGKVRSVP